MRSGPVHNFYRFGPVHEILESEDKDSSTVNSIFSCLFHRCHRFGPVRFTRLAGPVRFGSHILQIQSSSVHTFDWSGWIHTFYRSGSAHNFHRSGPVRQPFTNGIFSPFRAVTTFIDNTIALKKTFTILESRLLLCVLFVPCCEMQLKLVFFFRNHSFLFHMRP